jgi:hypothetical protein
MSAERYGTQGTALRALLLVCWLFVMTIVAMVAVSEYQILKHGEGKFGGLHRFPAIVLLAYYSFILLAGYLKLRPGGSRLRWSMVALVLILTFIPVVGLWGFVF